MKRRAYTLPVLERMTLDDPGDLPARPRTRGECVDGPRPCPWVGCRYHLALEVGAPGSPYVLSVRTDGIAADLSDTHLELMDATCALDVADAGEHPLEVVAVLIGAESNAREGTTRRTERTALAKLRQQLAGLR